MRTRFVPFVLAVVSAAACTSGHHETIRSTTPAPAGTSPPGDAAPTTAASTTPTTGSPGGEAQNPVRSGSTTTFHAAVPVVTATTGPPSGTPAASPAGHANTSPASAPRPATPGTYQERQSGAFTAVGRTTQAPPQGSLVVDAAQSNGTQVTHRYVQQGQGSNDTTEQYTAKGPFILSTTDASPQGSIVCTFNPAIPAPPWPPAVGATFSSTGSCGKTTVTVSGRITGQKSVPLGGRSYPTWVVDTTLNFQGQITGTGDQEDWYSPDLRVPLHEYNDMHGNFGPIPFSSQLTSDVTAIPPA